MTSFKKIQAAILSFTVSAATLVLPAFAAPVEAAATEFQNQQSPPAVPAPTSGTPTGKEMQELVAPIALYPDSLIAQVLAGATYPDQIVQADQWVQQNQSLKGEKLTTA